MRGKIKKYKKSKCSKAKSNCIKDTIYKEIKLAYLIQKIGTEYQRNLTKKLAKESLKSEKRRNLMVVIAVALAVFMVCFVGVVSTSLAQMQRNHALSQEPSEQGYTASFVYMDKEMMYIARDQMKLLEGRIPEKANEIIVSGNFLST